MLSLLLYLLSLHIQMNPMQEHLWENRILILSAPSVADSSYQQQVKILASQKAALEDRNLIVYQLIPNHSLNSKNEELNSSKVTDIRRYFDIQPETFSLLLIGKDGGEKMRTKKPAQAREIFGLIDTMPMRRQEMNSN